MKREDDFMRVTITTNTERPLSLDDFKHALEIVNEDMPEGVHLTSATCDLTFTYSDGTPHTFIFHGTEEEFKKGKVFTMPNIN